MQIYVNWNALICLHEKVNEIIQFLTEFLGRLSFLSKVVGIYCNQSYHLSPHHPIPCSNEFRFKKSFDPRAHHRVFIIEIFLLLLVFAELPQEEHHRRGMRLDGVAVRQREGMRSQQLGLRRRSRLRRRVRREPRHLPRRIQLDVVVLVIRNTSSSTAATTAAYQRWNTCRHRFFFLQGRSIPRMFPNFPRI